MSSPYPNDSSNDQPQHRASDNPDPMPHQDEYWRVNNPYVNPTQGQPSDSPRPHQGAPQDPPPRGESANPPGGADPYAHDSQYGSDRTGSPYGGGTFSNPQSGGGGGGPYGPSSGGTASGSAGASAPMTADEEKTWAIIAHVSALVSALVSVGYLAWLVPLIIYLVYRDRSAFVRQASAGALNFALTILIANLLATGMFTVGLGLAVLVVPLVFAVAAVAIWAAILIMAIVIPILAAMAANRGEAFRYPLTIPIIR